MAMPRRGERAQWVQPAAHGECRPQRNATLTLTEHAASDNLPVELDNLVKQFTLSAFPHHTFQPAMRDNINR